MKKPSAGQLDLRWQGVGLRDQRGRRFREIVQSFSEFGTATKEIETQVSMPELSNEPVSVPVFVNEFWTARQRQASALHEISYRACFKPQLPRFYIERLTDPGDVVYDPFMGRGTTLLEAGLMGRVPFGCDVSPLSECLIAPRLDVPSFEEVEQRLRAIPLDLSVAGPEDLLTFYHPGTLQEICALKAYLLGRVQEGQLDRADQWIRMVALNRLTGHSPGFFSVYSLPPNQAVSVKSQRRINEKRGQVPAQRDVKGLILKKSRRLLGGLDQASLTALRAINEQSLLVTRLAHDTPEIPSESVALVVTSPPFLNVVDYATDNWLRCWFLGVDGSSVPVTTPKKVADWEEAMSKVFLELYRVLRPGGHVAFEVGEVLKGTVKLESVVLRCGFRAGLQPGLVMINDQAFTKTANCWGVDNNAKGTNSNRIVVFSKPA